MGQAAYDTAALALSGIQHYWKLTETSGTTAADSQGSTTLTYGADVSGFLTTGPDGVASVPVNNGTANRVAINTTGFAPPATASYFWWQRYDTNEAGDQMVFELANSPTFSHLVQNDIGYSSDPDSGGPVVSGTVGLISVDYGGAGNNAIYYNRPTTGAWDLYCITVDPSAATANQVKIYRNGVDVAGGQVSGSTSLASLTPATMQVGVLGRNNNGTRGLPIKAAVCGMGVTNTVISTGTMALLRGAMLGQTVAVGRATETDAARQIVAVNGGRVTLEQYSGSTDGWNHNAFPGLAQAPDGNYVAGYQHTNVHAATQGTIRIRRFTPAGETLSVYDIRTVLAADPDVNICDVSLWATSSSEIAVLWNESSTPGTASISTTVARKIAFSTDSGVTWGAATDITSQLPFPSNGAGTAGAYGISPAAAIRVPAGTVLKNGTTVSAEFFLLATYGWDDKTDLTAGGYVKVSKSTDACRTWTTYATPFPKSATDRDYDETALLLLDSGQILSVSRTIRYPAGRGSGNAYVQTESRSDDGGATWSTPATTLGSGVIGAVGYGGRPDIWQTPAGVVFLRARIMQTSGASGFPSYRRSNDRGLTWGTGRDPWDLAAERTGAPSSPRGVDVYSATANIAGQSNKVVMIWSEEDPSNTAALYLRTLTLPTAGQATETDTAQAIRAARLRTLAQATETDAAGAITPAKVFSLVRAAEVDSAQPFTVTKTRTLGRAVETDTAQPVAKVKRLSLGQAPETSTARPIGKLKVRLLGRTLEVDTAQPIGTTGVRIVPVGQVQETDAAQPFGRLKVVRVGPALETDIAQRILQAGVLLVQVGQAMETDTARPLVAVRRAAFTYAGGHGFTYSGDGTFTYRT